MAQKITLSLKESNVKFIKKHALTSGTSVSKIVDDYLDLLHKIDIASKKETDTKIDQVLTPDQKKKLEDLRAAKKARMQSKKDNHKESKPADKIQE